MMSSNYITSHQVNDNNEMKLELLQSLQYIFSYGIHKYLLNILSFHHNRKLCFRHMLSSLHDHRARMQPKFDHFYFLEYKPHTLTKTMITKQMEIESAICFWHTSIYTFQEKLDYSFHFSAAHLQSEKTNNLFTFWL